MKRKSAALTLAVILVFSAFLGGCGNEGDSGSSQGTQDSSVQGESAQGSGEESEALEENVDPMGKYDEEVKVTFFGAKNDSIKFNEGEDYYNNIWTQHYKEALNVSTEYLWLVDSSQYEQQVAMAVTTRELADIMVFSVGDKNMQTLYENDQLQDLSEVYEKYASDLTKSILSYDGGGRPLQLL